METKTLEIVEGKKFAYTTFFESVKENFYEKI